MPSLTDYHIETLIDGKPFAWTVSGDFAWGAGAPLAVQNEDPLLSILAPDGYRIVDLPPGTAEFVRQAAAKLLGFDRVEDLERYHVLVDEMRHRETAQRNVDLRLRDLDLPGEALAEYFGGCLGIKLATVVPKLGNDVVQLRIIRPGTRDYNPPHRDGAIPTLRSTLNIWLPIVGVDHSSSLPIIPGSHLVAEADCWQTALGSASIEGRRYNVPAITRFRDGPLAMIRAGVRFGQALLFTPNLVHGLGANLSGERTRMAIELRFAVEGPAA